MTRVSLMGDLSDLIGDLRTIRKEAPVKERRIVRDGVKAGTQIAKENARQSAGAHGKHYPNAITGEMSSSLFGNVTAGEYGPERGLPQGDMEFEFGSRNQKPHLDLARSADVIAPSFAQEVRHMLDELFWPAT